MTPSANSIDETSAIQDFYDAFAPHYDAFYELIDYPAWAAIMQQQLDELLPAPRRILEAGCGTGAMLCEIAKYPGQSCVGVDVSSGMLQVCRSKLKFEPKVELAQSDLFALGFQTECFDAVLGAFSLLNFFPSFCRKDLLKEVWRILKPGGIFLTDYFTTHRYQQLLQALAQGREASHQEPVFTISQIFPTQSSQSAPSFVAHDQLMCERILRVGGQILKHPLYFIDPQQMALDFSAMGFQIVDKISLVRDSSATAPNRVTLIGRKPCPSFTSK
ncbi:class I SAM-dependent methyltransferase [candidate division KSB1 bacterium]|nr:class I SAM-dependent methyltransferase [candidate division KSB1 bacterium]